MKRLSQYFLRGLVTILPLGITVYVLYVFLNWSETLAMRVIRPFVGDEVEQSFDAAVADRTARGLTVTSSFVGLREMTLAAAEFDPTTKRAKMFVK